MGISMEVLFDCKKYKIIIIKTFFTNIAENNRKYICEKHLLLDQ